MFSIYLALATLAAVSPNLDSKKYESDNTTEVYVCDAVVKNKEVKLSNCRKASEPKPSPTPNERPKRL